MHQLLHKQTISSKSLVFDSHVLFLMTKMWFQSNETDVIQTGKYRKAIMITKIYKQNLERSQKNFQQAKKYNFIYSVV